MKYLIALLTVLFLLPACSSSFKIKRKGIYEAYKASQMQDQGKCTPMMLEKVWVILSAQYYRELKPAFLWKLGVIGLIKGGGLPILSNEYLDFGKYNIKPSPEVMWHAIDNSSALTGLSRSDLCYAVIDGMVDGLDRFTRFTKPKDIGEYIEHNYAETFGGTGIVLVVNKSPFRVFVDHVILGSPAERAGLQTSDELILINDIHVAKLKLPQVISQLRGKNNSTIEISIRRGGPGGKYMWFKFQRGKVDYKMAWCKVDEEKRVYCRLHGFKDKTSDELEEAVNNLPPHKKEIIFDLRNNPGGLIFSATNIAAKFWLGHKRLAIIEKRGTGFIDFNDTSVGKPIFAGWKTIFLTNHGTASASEMLLAAVKDYRAGVIIGETTYGKGVGQSLHFVEGGLLACTTLWVLSPSGTVIHGKGVEPDLRVPLTLEQFASGRDTQLEMAYQALKAWK